MNTVSLFLNPAHFHLFLLFIPTSLLSELTNPLPTNSSVTSTYVLSTFCFYSNSEICRKLSSLLVLLCQKTDILSELRILTLLVKAAIRFLGCSYWEIMVYFLHWIVLKMKNVFSARATTTKRNNLWKEQVFYINVDNILIT